MESPLIILVDDNMRHAGQMQATLEAGGFQVLHTRSGAETIRTARTAAPALLVLEYTLPDMSARDIIDGLSGEGFDFPFMIVTGQDSTTIAVEMMKLGARDFLLKNSAEAGNLPEVVGNVLDRIGREQDIEKARQAMGREEEMLSTAFEYSSVGTLIAHPDGRIKRVNEAISQMLNLSEPDLLGKSLLSFIHPEDRGRCKQMLVEMSQCEIDDFQSEDRLLDQRGKIIWVQTTCWMVRGEKGVPRYIVIHMKNINKRKQAEQELKISQEIATAYLEAMPLGVFTLTADGKPYFANRRATDLLGKGIVDTNVDGLAETYSAYIVGTNEPYPSDRMPVVRALTGEQCSVSDMEIDRPGGRVLLEVWGSPVYDNNGTIQYAIATFTDITSRAQLEAELNRDQRLKAMGTQAGGISHDFNNILFTMLGFARLAKEHTVEHKETHKNLLRLEEAGNRGLELVKQVLSFGRPPGLEHSPLKINMVIEETLELLQATIPPGVGIIKNIEADCGPVLADFTQVHLVMMNLMTNAVQAMKRMGGILQIDLENVEMNDQGLTGLEKLAPGRYVKVKIADTGHGMSNATLERIFEPYFTTKEAGQGTGLGLYTVYGIVSSLGGGIRVDSRIDEGTTFEVYFPVQPETAITHYPTDSPAAEEDYRVRAK
jgi:PAS domain S-box-containing protein